jgi:ParB family transcriptional regulator, chromosome partitioning protein
MAARKRATRKKPAARRRKAAPEPCGLTPAETLEGEPPPAIAALEARVARAGGAVVGRYREPLGAGWLVLAVLPLARVAPTPFQRDLSDAHVKRLQDVIARVGAFLDPLIAVPAPASAATPGEGEGDAGFWVPNGFHRLSALQRLGARSVTALVSPDPALAYRILALNTEKAHNTRERALEAVRMARGLADLDPDRRESELALELEDGSLVTLGLAYEARPRFAGGAYAPVLKASDAFLELPLPEALALRERRAQALLAIEDRVAEIVRELQQRGFESPYLRNFVVSRIRPFRRRGQAAPEPDALLEHMAAAAARFDASRIRSDQVSRAAGAPE